MIRQSSRVQRTIKSEVEVRGIGFVTGADICARFCPAPASSGVVFVRKDLSSKVCIPAHIGQVTQVERRTTLGDAPSLVTLTEHALAALAGLRIDNCRVELDGPELPGMDGSALAFTEALISAGIQNQEATRSVWQVTESATFTENGTTISLHPSRKPGLKLSYFLDYGGHRSLGRQLFTTSLTPTTFRSEIASARTFILESEIEMLRAKGLGARTTPRDLLVFTDDGVLDNELHWANEPARHKVLDMIGDLALLGVDLQGHVIGYRSGHPQNVKLAQILNERLGHAFAQPRAA